MICAPSLSPRNHWTMAIGRRACGPLMLLALLAIGGQAWAAAGDATGDITVAYAEGTTPKEDVQITASPSNIMDPDTLPDPLSLSWQWSAAEMSGGTYEDIDMATTITFTPGDDEAGKFLQVCASFMDAASTPNSEKLCRQIDTAVENVNDAPTGAPFIFNFTGNENFGVGPDQPVTSVHENTSLAVYQVTTAGSTAVTDNDGLPPTSEVTLSWQIGNATAGWTEHSLHKDRTTTALDDADVALGMVRICMFYTDRQGTAEGGDVTTAATRVASATLCSTPLPVINTNTRPVATASSVSIPPSATHTFIAANFLFTDADSPADDLASVIIETVPAAGTLANDGTALTGQTTIAVADIGGLVYTPATSAADGEMTTFTFNVVDDGDDNHPLGPGDQFTAAAFGETSTTAATFTINLQDIQIAASGAPTVAATDSMAIAHNEDVELTASTTGITEPNGIDTDNLAWEWQAAPAPDTGTPAAGTYTAIANATAITFTPGDDQVGQYIRVCATFADLFSTPASSTLCSTGTIIANINDAPTTQEGTITVFTNATAEQPHVFTIGDFPYIDRDGDALVSVTFSSAPTKGTVRLDGADVTSYPVTAMRAQIDNGMFGFYPEAEQEATSNYARITWSMVDDGNDPDSTNTESTITSTIFVTLEVPGPLPATGAPTVPTPVGSTTYTEDEELTASTAGINEPNGINTSTVMWIWQQAPAPESGAPADDAWATISGAPVASATFTPTQANVGNWLRACVFFTDSYTGTEGAAEEGGTADAPTLCSVGTLVANVNDAPTSSDTTVSVFTTASAAEPYTFKAADFPFMDEDGDELSSISIAVANLPTGATLTNDGTALTADIVILSAANLGDLQFYPASGTTATENYASLTFSVSDGTTTSGNHTLTINIVPPGPLAASGQPAITGTAEQKATLTATTGTVADANGINQATIAWQWQQATAADSTDWADIPNASGDTTAAGTFIPTQAQVEQYVRVCITFMDNHDPATPEGPLCSDAIGPIADVNDAPEAKDTTYQAARDGNSNTVAIPVSAFTAAYMDADPDDSLASVTIITLPEPADGSLNLSNGAVQPGAVIAITNGEFENGPLTFTIAETAGSLQHTELTFTLSDGTASSTPSATMRITFGKDIEEEQATQISAILSVAAVTNATNAIGGAISSVPTTLSIGGTSLKALTQTLHQSKTVDSPHHAWYHSTTANWEYTAAYNAADNSRSSLLNRLQSMANGDIALNYSLTDTSNMRFWARYQSLDINGNEGESLEYDGSGTGFYLGADNQITDTMRIGLAIGTDSSDITLDLDEDGTDDEATRSATSFYPYLHIDLGNNNNARVIAGFGSGTLDIKSTANSNSTASADLSWNMLAASISHHRPMKGNLSARFDGSLQLGNTSTDETTFSSGSTLMAGKSSANELTINAELRYQKNNITPFASLAARKLGGDISQSVALDMAFGADLQTNPANLRIAITRQINDTTHQRHSISIDASTNPNPSGLSASLGSRYDSLTGRPQWQSTLRWQHKAAELSLAASQSDLRLQARLRW